MRENPFYFILWVSGNDVQAKQTGMKAPLPEGHKMSLSDHRFKSFKM